MSINPLSEAAPNSLLSGGCVSDAPEGRINGLRGLLVGSNMPEVARGVQLPANGRGEVESANARGTLSRVHGKGER